MAEPMQTVVARFDGPEAARGAMVALEAEGIDADAINLVDRAPVVPTLEGGLAADLDASRRVIDSSARHGIIGAVIGAAVFVVVLLAMRVQPVGAAVALGALGGGIAGFLMGGFIGGARRIPVNEDAFETYQIDPSDPAGVAVEVRVANRDKIPTVLGVLRRHHPRQLQHSPGSA